MNKIYHVNFPALSAEEKVRFVYHLEDHAAASFEDQPFSVQLLAETLLLTRWWNSYQYMVPEDPTPEILRIAIEKLWDLQESKCTAEDFERFQKSFSACTLEIMTGDDSELFEDPERDAFYRKYFNTWPLFYSVFLSALSTVLEEAVEGEVSWSMLEDMIYGDIGDNLIDFFETIYKKDTGGYFPSELDRRDSEVYSTPTFARVIAEMQQDMRAALSATSLPQLRKEYQKAYLFTPEECARISYR